MFVFDINAFRITQKRSSRRRGFDCLPTVVKLKYRLTNTFKSLNPHNSNTNHYQLAVNRLCSPRADILLCRYIGAMVASGTVLVRVAVVVVIHS